MEILLICAAVVALLMMIFDDCDRFYPFATFFVSIFALLFLGGLK